MAPQTEAKAKAESKAEAKPKAKGKAKAKAAEPVEEKLQKVDSAAYGAKEAAVREDIEKLQREQAELIRKIEERNDGKEAFIAHTKAIRGEMDQYAKNIDALITKKTEIKGALDSKKQEADVKYGEYNKMKKSLGFNSEAEIDDRIETIEFQLQTESLPLKEEKKLVSEIQVLKRTRPQVGRLRQMAGDLPDRSMAGASMFESKKAVEEELNKFWKLKNGAYERLQDALAQRKLQTGDLTELYDAKTAKSTEIAAKIKERKEIRDELRLKEREYREYEQEQRRIRNAKAAEERAAKEAEWKLRERERKAAEFDNKPYVKEMTLIEQTMLWCRTLIKPKGCEVKVEHKEISVAPPEGTEVLVKKEDRDDEFWVAPTKGKKATKPKSKPKAEPGTKVIKHNAETFHFFDMLRIDTPITTDDIPSALEKLEGEMAKYKALVKDWEVTRDEMKRKVLSGDMDDDVKIVKEPAQDTPTAHQDTPTVDEYAEEGKEPEEAAEEEAPEETVVQTED